MTRRVLAPVLLAVCLLAGPAAGELLIEEAQWQFSPPGRGRPVYAAVETLLMVPPRIDGRLRARIVLKNRGPHEADGILLRYALTARLAPLAGEEEGEWAVPFMIEEKRVPKVGPNRLFEVLLDPSRSVDLPLTRYLKRVHQSGFRADQLKLQIMLSPHRGAVDAVKTREIILQLKKAR